MSEWTFLTNHAQVLLCVARDAGMTAREIATTVGITERAVQRILADLETTGYLTRARDGRRNRYEIHPDAPMRHPAQGGRAVRELFALLTSPVPALAPTPTPAPMHAPKGEQKNVK